METTTPLLTTTTESIFDPALMPPTGEKWLEQLSAVYIVFLVIGSVATAATLILSVIHIYYIFKFVGNEFIQADLYFITVLLPVVASCSLIGMYLPRSAVFMYTICLTYLMLCLIMIVSVMKSLFNGRPAITNYLTSTKQYISLRTPPLCCCCKCLPNLSPTEANLRLIEWLVLQSPITRIILEIIMVILFLEQTYRQTAKPIISGLEVLSMISGTWACQVLIRLSQEKLKDYRFGAIFLFINITQVFFTLQKFLFDMLGRFRVFDIDRIIAASKAMYWNNVCLTIEMLILGILACYLVHPKRSALFDLYGKKAEDCERPQQEITNVITNVEEKL